MLEPFTCESPVCMQTDGWTDAGRTDGRAGIHVRAKLPVLRSTTYCQHTCKFDQSQFRVRVSSSSRTRRRRIKTFTVCTTRPACWTNSSTSTKSLTTKLSLLKCSPGRLNCLLLSPYNICFTEGELEGPLNPPLPPHKKLWNKSQLLLTFADITKNLI